MTIKQNNGIYAYDLIPYPRKLWVVVGKDYEFVKSKFRWDERSDGYVGFPQDDLWSKDSNVCTFNKIEEKSTCNYGILVWIINTPNGSTIAHESFHVASMLFDEVGVEYDSENQEVFAYPIGQVYEYIENAIRKSKKHI